MQNIVAIDLGATSTKIGIFDNDKLIAQEVFNTSKDPEELAENICTHIINFTDYEPLAIGVGAAGFWDEKCLLKQSLNLPELIDYPLWEIVSKSLNLPVFLKTDVELAVMGEAVYGLKNKYNNVLYINMGTGFSAGLYKDGEIFTTSYSPTLRLSFMVQAQLLNQEESTPFEQNLQSIITLSSTLINLACILSPEIIVFGGGKVDNNWDSIIAPAIDKAQEYLDQVLVYKIKFSKAKLEYPTLYGAYELVKREVSSI